MSLLYQAVSKLRIFPRTFWIVVAGTFLNQLGNMAFVFLVPYLTQHLGYSLFQASMAFATFGLFTTLSGMFFGTFIDRYGPTRIMIGTLFMNTFVLLSFLWCTHLAAILVLCVMWGIIYGLFRSATQTLISFLAPPGLHKITYVVYRWAMNLGMSIGPAVGGFIAAYSFTSLFAVNACTNIIASLVLVLGLARTKWFSYRHPGAKKIELSLKWLKHDAVFRTFLIGIAFTSMVFFQHESTLAVFLTQNLNFSLSFYGLLFTLNTLIIVFCELPLNLATLAWRPRTSLMLGSLLIGAGFAGFAFASLQWHVLFLTVLWTFGEMILFPSATTYVAEIAPEQYRGSYMSLYNASSNLGLCLGPLLGGMIMHQFSAGVLWGVCGVWGIMSVLAFKFLPDKNHHSPN